MSEPTELMLARLTELNEKLTQFEQNVQDFEALAHQWKKAYGDLLISSNKKYQEKNQVILEMEDEIRALKLDVEGLERRERFNSRN